MRIGMYATNEYPYPLPPHTIHAVVAVAGELTKAMIKRGHHVDLFTAAESKTPAHDHSFGLKAFANLPISKTLTDSYVRYHYSVLYSQRLLVELPRFFKKHPVDVMHFHNIHDVLPILPFLPDVPKVITVHESLFESEGIFSSLHHFGLEQFKRLMPNTYFVSISKRQRQGMPQLPFFANAYNGINTDLFKFNPKPKHQLMFSGRFIPAKGVDVALEAGRQADYPMRVVGLFDPRVNVDAAFKAKVLRLLKRPGVSYAPTNVKQLAKYYGQSEALLVPIQWEEPFGLVMTEAMSCGTPVIAFKRGAAPEIVKDGKTGFIVRTLPEMVRAIKKIPTIDRQACRDHVLKNFSYQAAFDRYEAIYEAAIAAGKKKRQRV